MSCIGSLRGRWAAPLGYREVLRIGLPLLAGMISTTIMQFTDRLFLSHYSLEAIAASAPAVMASLTLQMTFHGICSYSSVLAAQYIGARALNRVGPAVWQGVWCALFCSLLLLGACFMAEPLFDFVGHEEDVRILEVRYFITLTSGASLALLGAALSSYFFGRGLTKPVMWANMAAALVNIALDYMLIFGEFGAPELGILGAGLATAAGWLTTLIILAVLIFRRENDAVYHVLRGWRPERDLFLRLVRFGLPGGMQFFVEFTGMTWFMFELGSLGKIPMAASNIVFAINNFTFMPMLGLSMAAATMVGQAMGRQCPLEAETAALHALHLAFFYMFCTAALIVFFAGDLMDVFRRASSQAAEGDFDKVRATGIVLLYYVALYSLVDAANLIFFGALRGAGDTVMMMKIIVVCVFLFLFVPFSILHMGGWISLHRLWLVFTAYVFILAACVTLRFRSRKWHKIKVIEAVRVVN
ncbi:MAG: MATE family efflux transporter [Deltaproteobacteria bacterium]|nr:MATE family efflux transporter [Deltaproteobacteria bacterium]